MTPDRVTPRLVLLHAARLVLRHVYLRSLKPAGAVVTRRASVTRNNRPAGAFGPHTTGPLLHRAGCSRLCGGLFRGPAGRRRSARTGLASGYTAPFATLASYFPVILRACGGHEVDTPNLVSPV